MKRYTAVTTSAGPIDIGEFPSDNAAQVWALERFGADLETVITVPQFSTTATAVDPLWFALAAAGLLLLVALGSKRGRNVR